MPSSDESDETTCVGSGNTSNGIYLSKQAWQQQHTGAQAAA